MLSTAVMIGTFMFKAIKYIKFPNHMNRNIYEFLLKCEDGMIGPNGVGLGC